MTRTKLTDIKYWDDEWGTSKFKKRTLEFKSPYIREVAKSINDILEKHLARGTETKILEVGCANSAWLPYLAEESGATVYGIDYSYQGCENAKSNLQLHQVNGTVICEDFLSFDATRTPKFDLIVSFGVIEHFDPPTEILGKMREMLTNNGVILLTIPNFGPGSVLGILERVIDEKVYKGHLPMSARDLAYFLKAANLKKVTTKYIGGLYGLRVVNFSMLEKFIGNFGLKVFSRLLRYSEVMITFILDRVNCGNLQSRRLSPHILGIAKK